MGGGTLTLEGGSSNSYAGGMTVLAGVVQLDNLTAAGTGVVTIDGGEIDFAVGVQFASDVDLNGGTLNVGSGTTIAGNLIVTSLNNGNIGDTPSYWFGSGTVNGTVTSSYGGNLNIGTADTPATLNANGGVLITGSGQLAADDANSQIVAPSTTRAGRTSRSWGRSGRGRWWSGRTRLIPPRSRWGPPERPAGRTTSPRSM